MQGEAAGSRDRARTDWEQVLVTSGLSLPPGVQDPLRASLRHKMLIPHPSTRIDHCDHFPFWTGW
jgi:hypothetical protein